MGSRPKLPRFIVIKSERNDNYLRHVHESVAFHRFLQFSGTDFQSPHVKFEVEPSTTVDELVHLKCCYNNKYWVAHDGQEHWICVEANEKEEDQSKSLCTLFKPEFMSTGRFALYHVHYKTNVKFLDGRPLNLYAGSGSEMCEYLDYIDWETLPILPKFIALKGDNKCFLSATQVKKGSGFEKFMLSNPQFSGMRDETFEKMLVNGPFFLRFNWEDMGDQTVGNEVFTNSNGTIRIKNNHTGRFWRLSPKWIWPDASYSDIMSSDTLFEVEKVGHNKIALKNLGNDCYCIRLSADGKSDCLNANSSTIPKTAELEVFELVRKRAIYDVHFHLEHARVYKREIVTKTAITDKNRSNITVKATLEFTYTKTERQTWNTSISTKQGIETEITAGVPVYVEAKFKLLTEVTQSFGKGTTLSETKETKVQKEVEVPPMSRTKGILLVTQALCDVPYSYSRCDTLTDGNIDISHMDDGVYTSIHTELDFDFEQMEI